MSDDVAELLAHLRIRQVLERYCRGIDRVDIDLVSQSYWEDSIDDHGVYVGPGADFAATMGPRIAEAYTQTVHVIGQSYIELEGAFATAETYFVAYHIRPDGASTCVDVAGGRYVDLFEQRRDEWRIKDRTVVMEWVESRSGLENARISLDNFQRGRRDRSDLSSRPVSAFTQADS
jgi:hypothetical protein